MRDPQAVYCMMRIGETFPRWRLSRDFKCFIPTLCFELNIPKESKDVTHALEKRQEDKFDLGNRDAISLDECCSSQLYTKARALRALVHCCFGVRIT